MLSRLGIRQKLSLLLTVPLAAVVLVMVPFTAERIADAGSAGVTARTSMAAREVGALIQSLQQERLLAMAYLAAASLDRSALIAQAQTAIDDAARLRDAPVTTGALAAAKPELDALATVRQRVVDRAIAPGETYDAYRNANAALLDGLHLVNPPGADAEGLGQLGALEALMRSNEEASSAGAILVGWAIDPGPARSLLAAAVTADEQHRLHFRELVDDAQWRLVDTIDNGQAGQRIRELISHVDRTTGTPDDVSAALTAALSYTGLRRLAEDRVAREIATAAESRASAARTTAWVVTGGAIALFVVVVSLGVTVSRSIARPLRRLTRAATIVAELSGAELVRVADSDSPDPVPPKLAAVEVDSSDEIGELAAALNRVQATAALLLERQVTTRRNVAVMFANIGRRTQNLVGRQLTLIDDLERGERNPELLQRLYRLDHVATRLRRSADSLLVVSGTIDQVMSGTPAPLVDVVRSALSEIEGYRAVEVGEICEVAIAADVVGDLRLLLAELLENATNFSPPGTSVEVSATLDEECHIVIVDNGVGLSQPRLDEENRRLVERERLDVAPTTVLGLFVVGRLARRHGLGVRLEPSEERGVTARVRIPARLLTVGPVVGTPSVRTRVRPEPAVIDAIEVDVIEATASDEYEPFDWFARADELVVVSSGAGPMETHTVTSPDVAVGRASVARVTVTPRADEPAPPPGGALPWRVPGAVSDAFGDPIGVAPESRAGLVRRVPGTHLVEAMGDATASDHRASAGVGPASDEGPTLRIDRDPEAERDALNDYLSGYARASGDPGRADQREGYS